MNDENQKNKKFEKVIEKKSMTDTPFQALVMADPPKESKKVKNDE